MERQEKYTGLQLKARCQDRGLCMGAKSTAHKTAKPEKKKNHSRNKARGNNKNKKLLRSIEVQDLEQEENLCMCEEEGEVAVIERKEAKGDKINCDYLAESRRLTVLSDS